MAKVLITGTSSESAIRPRWCWPEPVTRSTPPCETSNEAPPSGTPPSRNNYRSRSSRWTSIQMIPWRRQRPPFEHETGSIDVLVNNAGIERSGSIEGLALDDFKATMETNYFGPLRTIRAWLPDMRQRQSGCIINVTSVAGKIACSPLTPYAATKFALEALSEGLAQEVKPFNIRVAVVEPGIIDTPMARNIEQVPTDAAYPQVRRFGHMFEASLDNADAASHRRGEDSRDYRKRHIQAAASRRPGRRGVSCVARVAE